MSENKLNSVGIVSTGYALAEMVITNKELLVDTSYLCTAAAEMALADADINPIDVDLIIVATATPDMIFPATACLVQERIGAKRAAAFDLEAACTGFIYALTVGQQFIASGMYKTVLVIGAETLSKIANKENRDTPAIFRDGAGAVVIQMVPKGYGILANYLGSDGGQTNLLSGSAGGSIKSALIKTATNREHFIKMTGNDFFDDVRIMEDAADEVLKKAGLTKDDVDFLVPHHANIRTIDAAVKRLCLPDEKVIINIHKYGNISSAAIPVALHEANVKGGLKQGDIIIMVGFGGDLTWGSSVMRWYEK